MKNLNFTGLKIEASESPVYKLEFLIPTVDFVLPRPPTRVISQFTPMSTVVCSLQIFSYIFYSLFTPPMQRCK